MKISNRPKGTRDIYPLRSLFFHQIRQIGEKVLARNNFQPIIIPTYEYAELFNTSLGTTTDIIHKEMFNFADRKGRSLALRPEGTVGTMRLILQNRIFTAGYPLKFYYWANMFRYERPQKGRYREFWQLGVELVNAAGIMADFQILQLVREILEGWGIKQFTLHLNYLGDRPIQEKYKQKLKAFLAQTNLDLCSDCQRRVNDNPLRILDCNSCGKKIAFPNYQTIWNEQDKNYWLKLKQILETNNFSYQYDNHLVRGLDYYTGLVFEINLGEEKSLVGGGRYDHLAEELGGINLPAIGFAMGIDRLVNYCEKKQLLKISKEIDIFFLTFNSDFWPDILTWKKVLEKNFLVDYNLELKSKPNIPQIINYYQPRLLVLLREEIRVKDCQKSQEFVVKKDKLLEWINNYFFHVV